MSKPHRRTLGPTTTNIDPDEPPDSSDDLGEVDPDALADLAQLEAGDALEPGEDLEHFPLEPEPEPAPRRAPTRPAMALDPFAPPKGATSCTLYRLLGQGAGEQERCEVHDPASGAWVHHHALPLTSAEIITLWGSGRYRMVFHKPSGRLGGQRGPVHLEHPDHPTLPARHRPQVAPRPRFAERAPERPREPERPVPPPPRPAVPPGGEAGASSVLAWLDWAESRAQADFDRRIAMLERDAREAERRADERHRRDMAEREAAHRRALEGQAAMASNLIAAATTQAQSRAPLGRLQAQLDELREELGEREPEQSGALDQLLALAPMALEALRQAKPRGGPGSAAGEGGGA